MSDQLDLVQLRTLLAIDDCGGFHRAAVALHLSQSTVSQHVRSLERAVGRPLVEKAGRGSRFTPMGERLLVEARAILAVHDQALARLEVDSTRPVRVGCTEHAADQVLPGLLTALNEAFPARPVRFRLDRSTRLAESVTHGDIDLAVVLETDRVDESCLVTLPLRWFASSVVARRLIDGPPDGAVALVAFEEPCGLRRRALAALAAAGRDTSISVDASGLDGVIAAARAGLGVALLPSAGAVPSGLTILPDLPDVGSAALRLLARRGVEPRLQQAALVACRGFLDGVAAGGGATAAPVSVAS